MLSNDLVCNFKINSHPEHQEANNEYTYSSKQTFKLVRVLQPGRCYAY